MYTPDKTGFKKFLNDFPKQIMNSIKLYDQANIEIDQSRIQNIVFIGMGGSAIAGDLLNDIFFANLDVPLQVVRSYYIPAYISDKSLVILSSYSGDTEETLTTADQLKTSSAQILAVTSGGKLAKKAEENNWNIISIPAGFPPRLALGNIFFSIYHLLGKKNLISEYNEDLSSLSAFLREQIHMLDTEKQNGHVMAQELAKKILNKIPVIYSTAPFLSTISGRWQNQIHENAKSLAFSNIIPEMNHNEIVGWEMNQDSRKPLVAIFLESKNSPNRIEQRIELTKKIIKNAGTEVVDVFADGNSLMERAFALIALGDWVSYYLALLQKKDPMDIKSINFLKDELSKYN